jgi:cytochrome c oxidase subunit 1/cytochrome c oxidase subunit I+III
MFAVGLPQITLTFFAAASLIITIPSGIQFFAWLSTMLTGRPVLRTPLLYVVGFLIIFVIGGVTGVMFAAIPFDQQVTDSYFVVAHFHYVLVGGAVFPMLAGLFHWLPKMSGRMYHEGAGKLGFWLTFVGFNLAFFPMHISGLLGMPRRVYTYPADIGWDVYNLLATIGAAVLGLGVLAVLANVLWTLGRGAPAGPDPWDGDSLEWSTTSPPPHYNFPVTPVVRSHTPNWDREDRAADVERAGDEQLVMTDAHRALATTVLDAEADQAMEMPEASLWPLLLTLSLSAVVVGFMLDLWIVCAIAGAAALGCLAGWHRPKPELEGQ